LYNLLPSEQTIQNAIEHQLNIYISTTRKTTETGSVVFSGFEDIYEIQIQLT